MGLDNRHYIRRAPWQSGSSGSLDMPGVCKAIIITNVVVFLLQIFITRPTTLDDLPKQITEYYADDEFYSDEFAWQDTLVDEQASSDTIVPGADSQDSSETDQEATQKLAEERRLAAEKQRQKQLRQMLRHMPRSSVIQDWFSLDPEKVREGQLWRLLTSAFCHDRMSIFHLLFNMLFLYWFGRRLESMYGSLEFGLFYFASAILASVAFLLLQWYTGDTTPAIGASGAVWGVVVLFAIHHPYETINIYFLFPVQIRWLVLVYLVLDLHPVLLALNMPGGFSDGTAHAAHLGGAAFGYMYFKMGWRIEPYWNSLPIVGQEGPWQARVVERRPPSTLKIVREESKPSETVRADSELDRVLDKIHNEGRQSLTDEEVAILEQASRRYRGD